MPEPHFFNPIDDVKRMTNRLPHWQQAGGIYFVTFRLGDSLPDELLRIWAADRQAWLKQNPPPHTPEQETEYHRKFSLVMEQWLDAGRGSCALRQGEAGRVMAEALRFYEGRWCEMFSFVVMPNHVHALFGLLSGAEIDAMIGRWKSYVSHELAIRLREKWPSWQKDYFDRLVRNGTHFERCVRYIRSNPKKAGLQAGEFVLWESERAMAVL
ncbi:hypothetical protein Ga0100231_024960 [Opitutaceae bacterium TAV4]|nr:hypothetical protein Ga0100231_024960 [Opitutaceae bacterium TAV4]RRK01263.1 hypothetical protein Ga0100230_024765 [Opitutaceae bacterium TAV3]